MGRCMNTMIQTLIEAGNGGKESGALTGADRVLPSACCIETDSGGRTHVLSRTIAWASGIGIILYKEAGAAIFVREWTSSPSPFTPDCTPH